MRSLGKLFLFFLLVVILPVAVSGQRVARPYQPTAYRDLPGQPYKQFSTKDKFGRLITFYLSIPKSGVEAPARLPLAVYVQGSGCDSLFSEKNGQLSTTSGHSTVEQEAEGKARLLIVEKPGVRFLDQGNQGCQSNADFNREHTLDRWAEAIEAAILASRKLPDIDKSKTIVVGHSEGGLVAARVTRDLPLVVTHVAVMAGGGLSQLVDILSLTRRGTFFRNISEDANVRVNYVVEEWRKIQAEPTRADKFFFGFAYRRWSTFLASSPLDELARTNAKIRIVQGSMDEAVDPASADVLYAGLIGKGKRPVYDRVVGADHSFNMTNNPQVNGWREAFKRIFEWFTA